MPRHTSKTREKCHFFVNRAPTGGMSTAHTGATPGDIFWRPGFEPGEPFFFSQKDFARGFRKMTCITAPTTDNTAPTIKASMTRGIRICQKIALSTEYSWECPKIILEKSQFLNFTFAKVYRELQRSIRQFNIDSSGSIFSVN